MESLLSGERSDQETQKKGNVVSPRIYLLGKIDKLAMKKIGKRCMMITRG